MKFWQTCLKNLNLNHIFLFGSHRWYKLVFQIQSWKQEAEWGMAHTIISKTKETPQDQIKIKQLSLFFSSHRVVHKEFVPPGVTVNWEYYLEVLDHLRKGVMQVKIENCRWMDPSSFITMCLHIAWSCHEFLEKKCIPLLPQASYSPDMSTCEFHSFPKLKSRVKDYHFHTLDSIQKATTDAIKTL
jgi:hypothetical protein